jgi:DNA-binding response OmpR family regulator
MNGLDVVAAVRFLETSGRFLPLIMLTGHSDMTRLTRARDCGVTEFVTKPVSAKTVLGRLQAVIPNPRPFIKTRSFFGPELRRRKGSTRPARSDGLTTRRWRRSERFLRTGSPPVVARRGQSKRTSSSKLNHALCAL